MFSSIFLARRNMRARKGRTLLTLLGIVLGVAVVLAIQTTNQTTLDSLDRVFDRATGQAGLVITPINVARDPLDDDVLDQAARQAGVDVAAPSLSTRTLPADEASGWQIAFGMTGVSAGNFFQLYGIDPDLDPQVREYVLAAGRMPRPGKYEVVIPEKTAADKGLQIGQELALLAPGRPVELEIVGLLAGEGVALINDGIVGFSPLDVVQPVYGLDGRYDEISLKLATAVEQDPRRLEQLQAELEQQLGDEMQVAYPAARGQVVSQMLATYQMGLSFFSLIAIFVGAFLIYNTFSMTVVERTREIGMLRAVGMSRRQVLRMVLAEAGMLSLVGSAIGLVSGYWLARALMLLLGDLVTTQAEAVRLTATGVAQSVAIGIGVTLVAAALPARRAAYVSPLEALRARAADVGRTKPGRSAIGMVLMAIGWLFTFYISWPTELLFLAGNVAVLSFFLGATLTVSLAVGSLERLARPLATSIYRREGALGSANVRRSTGRTTLTVAALMVALTMIISIESLVYTFESDMRDWIDNALGGDLYVRAPLPMREAFGRQLAAVPGVAVVSPARILTIKPPQGSLPGEDETVNFWYEALEPQSFRQIGDMEFSPGQDAQAAWSRLEGGRAVFISNVVADRFDLHPGGELKLLTRRGEQSFAIAGEVVDFGGQGLVIYGTYDDMHHWFSEQGVDRYTIKVAPGATVAAVSAQIEQRFRDSHNISLQTTKDFKKSVLDLVDQSFRLFDVLNAIGVMIGALAVVNTLTMNVIERQREIGGLRSLGMTRGQVLRMVLAEALSLGVMGGIYGMAVGYLVARVVILGTNQMAGYDLAYRFTAQPYLVGAVVALGVVQAAAALPARKAAAVNIVEAIKHE